MQSPNHASGTRISNCHHVVDWQLVRTADTAAGGWEVRDPRQRIKELEARGMTLLLEVVADPRAVQRHRALAALDAEIAALRADLAWERSRSAEGGAALVTSHEYEHYYPRKMRSR